MSVLDDENITVGEIDSLVERRIRFEKSVECVSAEIENILTPEADKLRLYINAHPKDKRLAASISINNILLLIPVHFSLTDDTVFGDVSPTMYVELSIWDDRDSIVRSIVYMLSTVIGDMYKVQRLWIERKVVAHTIDEFLNKRIDSNKMRGYMTIV